MDRKTKTLRERILDHFVRLRIPLTADELDQVLSVVEREGLSFLEGVDRLLGEQAARRHERSIQRRVRAARFAEHKTLDTFDWAFNKTIPRAQYEQLATGDFIRRHVNIVLIGQSGVGKSHLMQAVGLSACAVGYRVCYTTSAQLLNRLTAALADKSLPHTFNQYASWDLLLVDEFGLGSCDPMLRALFVGIDRHADDGIRELVGASRDATALWALVSDTVSDVSATCLVNKNAHLRAIRAGLEAALTEASPEDTVIVSFAGHGTRHHRLVVFDTDRSRLDGTTIGLDEIADLFRESRARAVLCIVDCCFSGAAPRRQSRRPSTSSASRTSVRAADGDGSRFTFGRSANAFGAV